MNYKENPPIKVGIGYDVHKLVEGRDLILGTIPVKHHLGLEGHSDADVIIHAIMDAILGALGECDIGKLFPDTDQSFKDISSSLLLERVIELMKEKGYVIGNIDVVAIAQKPKLNPYREEMKEAIAKVIDMPSSLINIKFTTEEGLGFTGREEGIATTAICTLYREK